MVDSINPDSILSSLHRNLSRLEETMTSDEKAAAEIFKELTKNLQDMNSLDVNTLEKIERACVRYLQTLPKIDSRIKRLFSSSQTLSEEVLNIQKKITKTLSNAPNYRQELIQQELTKWRNLQGNELKDAMQNFIMRACKEKLPIGKDKSVPPCSIKQLFEQIQVQLSDKDEEIQHLLNDPHLFSSYEWKTGTRSPNLLNISACIASRKEKTMQVSEEIVNDTIEQMEAERDFRLRNLETIYNKVSDDSTQAVAGKQFESTSAWYIGSFIGVDRDLSFEKEMREIGANHDIMCITDSVDKTLKEYDNVLILDNLQKAAFPQDFVDFSINEVRIPVMNISDRYPEINDVFVSKFFRDKREARNPNWIAKIGKKGQSINPRVTEGRTIGEPLLKKYGKKSVALALGLGIAPIMNLTYNEGGNTLIGSRGGEKFAIIGQDSYEISKYFMEKDLGLELTEEQVKIAFAIDYGIKKENIFFVEQPGDFHLDMNVAIIGENIIAVNDALQAYKLFDEEQQRFLNLHKFSQKLQEQAKEAKLRRAKGKKIFEDITAENIEQHDFKVIRVPGRFDYQIPQSANTVPSMNFFNMVTATTPKGEKIIIAMGVIDEKFSSEFIKMVNLGGIKELYFLNLKESSFCLERHGGISCRAKVIPSGK